MAEVDPVVLRLLVEDGEYRARMEQTARRVSQNLDQQGHAVKRLERQMSSSSAKIGSALKGMTAGLGSALGAREIISMADGYTRLQNQLRVTGLEGEKLAEVQERLRTIGNTYGTDLESLATVYSRINVAAGELGATSEQILQVNEAVAAALKVNGSSAEQASGALLQLSQAMGSGVVRAEEFNSLLEGAFPLAQAAAKGIDRFGGSVSKLRSAVVDGKVSSQEFFQGILAGAPALIEQAAKANMTLAQSFTVVKNELMLYVGGAASANGVTGALATGIAALAANLDRIIPALATIAAFMGVRYVAASGAAIVSSVALSAAKARENAVMTASNAILAQNAGMLNINAAAATRMATESVGLGAAAKGAGTAMLAAFGGPVGAAVIALGASFYAIHSQLNQFEKSVSDLESELDALTVQADAMEEATRKAGGAITSTDRAARAAATGVDTLSDSYRKAAGRAAELAEKTGLALLKMQQLQIAEIQGERQALDRQERNRGLMAAAVSGMTGSDLTGGRGHRPEADAEVTRMRTLLDAKEAQVRRQIAATTANPKFGTLAFNPDAPASASPAGDSDKKTPRGRKGPDLEQQAFRAEQELQQLRIEELRGKVALATSADARAAIQREILDIERDSRAAEVEESVRRKEISAEEGVARMRILENLYGAAAIGDEIVVQARDSLYQRAVELDRERQLADERLQVATAQIDNERDLLTSQADLTNNREERRSIELRLLDFAFEQHRNELEAVKASRELLLGAKASADTQWQIANARLAILDQLKAGEAEGINRRHESPLARYQRGINEVGANLNDEYEAIAVDGLQSLNDGLTEAIMNAENFGDVFSNVAKQVIADMIRMAIQQTIVNNLIGGIGGLFGGGKTVAAVGVKNIVNGKGFSSGGYTGDGNPNEPAGIVHKGEYVMPANAVKRIGVQNLAALASGSAAASMTGVAAAARSPASPMQGTIRVAITMDNDVFDARVQEASIPVAVEVVRQSSSGIVNAAKAETMASLSRPRM